MSIKLESLKDWFSKSHPEGGWKRYNSKGEAIGPCAREKPGEAKPKCMSNEKAASLSKKERAAAVAAKRRHDPNPDRKGKPINVSNFGKGKISEMNEFDEESKPTNPELWSRAKSMARQKFDVYPSAYANGWAVKWYKSKGGGWRSTKEEVDVDEACWDGYKKQGMKKKGDKMVPNCVPEENTTYRVVKQVIFENLYGPCDNCTCGMLDEAVAAWQRKEGKNPEGGLNRKGIMSYRRENPGSKLSMAVTTKPSKLKPGSKAAKRRKSFCARMGGMKKRLTSAKTARDPDSRINKALRKWNC